MLHLDNEVFAPPWSRYYGKLLQTAFALALGSYGVYQFSQFFSTQMLLMPIVILVVILLVCTSQVYFDRKRLRELAYMNHLNTLPVDVLNKYLDSADPNELELIENALNDKQLF